MLRTHRCKDLNEKVIGQEATVCGWVDSRRDHGKLIFIDVRDRWGKLQVVFTPKPHSETYAVAKELRCEDVIMLKGDINERPKGTINPNIPTGKVELFGKELKILNSSADLPFTIEDDIEAGEEIRLVHRYLDLRRKPMLERLTIRHKANQSFRAFLDAQDFLEIETPFLTKSTPEGARDFLVPSRLNETKFYALPQSPQLFKQILMVAGVDRYYQIARCFRDEDLRKDRQPEFSQLDMEMSFVDEEDIFSLTENMYAKMFKEVLGVELNLPFPRVAYAQAMEKYGTDSPDVGEGDYRFCWVVDFPLFEFDPDSQQFHSQHHPFTSPNEEDIALLDGKDLSKVRARSYDLCLNGQEIASGSIRIHSPKLQKKIFDIIGIKEEEARERFDFLLRAFDYGAPPHAGIAFGLDRLYAIITKAESIREVIAFPKTQRGICPLTDAPSKIDHDQLEDLSIKVVESKQT